MAIISFEKEVYLESFFYWHIIILSKLKVLKFAGSALRKIIEIWKEKCGAVLQNPAPH